MGQGADTVYVCVGVGRGGGGGWPAGDDGGPRWGVPIVACRV